MHRELHHIENDLKSNSQIREQNKKLLLTSTWNKKPASEIIYDSETVTKYVHSDSAAYMEPWSQSNVSLGLDNHRGDLGKESIQRLQTMAEKKYGSMRNMLRAVNIIFLL